MLASSIGRILRPLLLAGAMSCAAATLSAQQPAGPVLRVDPERTFQTMVGFGSGFFDGTGKLIDALRNPADRVKAYDLLYGNDGVRLNVVRLTISPDARPLPASGAAAHRYDWAADQRTRSTWQAIAPVLKRAKPILYAVPFTPPARWKTNGRLKGGGSLKREFYRDYAEYLVDFLEYYRDALGTEIDVLSLQNEPGIVARWESCTWSGEELRDFLKIVAPLARARGLKTQFMLSEGTAWSGAWQRLQPTLEDPQAAQFLSVMASHSYGPPADAARRDFAAASARTGLPVWMSEMSLMLPPHPDDPTIGEAIRVAQFMHRDLADGKASVWIYCFAIFTAKFQGSMGVLAPPDGRGPQAGALVIPKRFWSIANYSRFVRPGWKLMQVDGGGPDSTGFVNPQGNGFVIVAINAGGAAQPVTYDFGARSLGAVNAFATTARLNLAAVAPPKAAPHRFSAMLAPMSVTTFEGGFLN